MMKYINREQKGTYGYIRKQLIFEIIKTVVLFAMALGIFFIGLITLHTKKSLWSVFAVLALLPACKSLVGVIMLARFKSLSAESYKKYSENAGNICMLYENILTSSQSAFYVPVMFAAGGSLVCYMPKGKDASALKSHLESVIKNAGHECVIKVFDNEDQFLKRLSEVSASSVPATNREIAIAETIKAVSV